MNDSAPEVIETERLLIRRPRPDDADSVFNAYASDPEVPRNLGSPRHSEVAHTLAFLEYAQQKWEQDHVGPYPVTDKIDNALLGGTGLEIEAGDTAVSGYVLARSAWGKGYATEALGAMLELGRRLPLSRVYALCHPHHTGSIRVLEKCGFTLSSGAVEQLEFPNLETGTPGNVLRYETGTRAQGPLEGDIDDFSF